MLADPSAGLPWASRVFAQAGRPCVLSVIVPVIALLGTTLVFVIWIVAHYWRAMRLQEMEVALKQDLLNRGT